MIRKTARLYNTLMSKIDQIRIDTRVGKDLVLTGSFKDEETEYVTDIDFTQHTTFNDTLQKALVRKLKNLQNNSDFYFMYLKAGINESLKPPWKISSFEGCDFNLERALSWLQDLKDRRLIDMYKYKQIFDILNKDSLKIIDLINIDKILDRGIRWEYKDIKRGHKVVQGRTYNFIDSLKGSAVLNFIFAYETETGEDEYVGIDVGLADKRYKREFDKYLYPFYQKDWYLIFKRMRKYILPEYKEDYYNDFREFNFYNALTSKIDLLIHMKEYEVLNDEEFNRIDDDLRDEIRTGIRHLPLKQLFQIYRNKMFEMAKPLINKYYDKLDEEGKRKFKSYLKLIFLSDIDTSRDLIIKRQNRGIKCPFFTKEREFIADIASKTNISKSLLYNCFYDITSKYNIDVELALEIFKNAPFERLRLIEVYKKEFIFIKGEFKERDREFLESLGGVIDGSDYKLEKGKKKDIQRYLITREFNF